MQTLNRAGAQVVRRAHISSGLEMLRHCHDLLVTKKLKGGSIETTALVVSPQPEMLQEVEAFEESFPQPVIRQTSSSDFPLRQRTDSCAAWQLS